MTNTIKPPERLERLALSLSGGGVRAVGFHLGTLDVLHRLQLLDKVHSLSSSSGGSMVSLGYAMSCQQDRSFDEFFGDFFRFMPSQNAMQAIVKDLKRNPASGRPTAVVAMAEVYRKAYFAEYFGDPKFGAFLQLNDRCHLENLIVNATDFKTGQTFRFRYRKEAQAGHQLDSGSQQVHLPHDLAAEFYLSDIMTASACLPGLLEPMFIPYDFRFDDPEEMTKALQQVLSDCDVALPYLAIMDGGIVDNQGISSILYALLGDRVQPLPTTSPWEYARVRRSVMHRPGPAESPDHPEYPVLAEVTGDVDLFIVSDAPEYRRRRDGYFPKQDVLEKQSAQAPSGDNRPGPAGIPGRFLRFVKRTSKRFMKWFVTSCVHRLQLGTVAFGVVSLLVLGILALCAILWGLAVAGRRGDAGFFTNVWQALNQTGSPELALGLAVLIVVGIAVLLITVVVCAAVISGGMWLRRAVKKFFPKYVDKPGGPSLHGNRFRDGVRFWLYVRKLEVGETVYMLRLRALSVFSLVAEIFMNRVRQLSYVAAIEREELADRILPVEIFKLRDRTDLGGNAALPEQHRQQSDEATPDLPKCPQGLEDIIGRASDVPTKLFVSQEELEELVIAGQATTCYCLMEFVLRHRAKSDDQKAFADLYLQVDRLWQRLAADPRSLLDERLAAGSGQSGT